VKHLRDFGRFEINKRHLGRQRKDRILVAEEEILHRSILNRVRLCWARRDEACVANNGRHFEQLF
jgi:hypothetical protein